MGVTKMQNVGSSNACAVIGHRRKQIPEYTLPGVASSNVVVHTLAATVIFSA
jgi:hypothetical protein